MSSIASRLATSSIFSIFILRAGTGRRSTWPIRPSPRARCCWSRTAYGPARSARRNECAARDDDFGGRGALAPIKAESECDRPGGGAPPKQKDDFWGGGLGEDPAELPATAKPGCR